MPFPRKFQSLLEIERGDVAEPDYIFLVYAVCAVVQDGCGWGGWMVECAFQIDGKKHSTDTDDAFLPVADKQICPRCGRTTFRTRAMLRMVPDADQQVPRHDYETVPLEYED